MTGWLIDDILDRSVVGGFTNVGYRIRSRGWSTSELQRMEGKVVLVTGAGAGHGRGRGLCPSRRHRLARRPQP
jgi:dehydrogenase/reductase SDR family member 12